MPPNEVSKVLGLIKSTGSVQDVIEQVDAAHRYQFVGTRSVSLRVTGSDFTGAWPVTANQVRFEVERTADGPGPATTLYADECGGGLDTFEFEPVTLDQAKPTYIVTSSIVRGYDPQLQQMKPTKLTVKPNEAMEIIGKLQCDQGGTYTVTAMINYDLATVKQPEIRSTPFNVVCPAEILSLNELTIDRYPQRAVLKDGFYSY